MDWVMIAIIAIVVLMGTALSAYMISNTINNQMGELYAVLLEKEMKEGRKPATAPSRTKKEETSIVEQKKTNVSGVNEEELIKKLRQVIDEKVERVLDEAKHRKEKLLMLLDVARGYTLGYITEDEYNAFLMKVLSELDEFKRLWLARFPSQRDREKLNLMINYITKTKLPIVLKSKDGKETINLPPEEALIRITSNINSAVNILDELISSRGENPAVTPLEVKLSQECGQLRAKVEKLEKQLEEYSALT
ncbi:hypothetical protein TON_1203 [Thermococcus onnurineus NA1]|uniref:Uncharacterized protein n=1 Tax=Thermococcus onnurineus (strain NA1) TaxID=523850 RepID=B6YX78_THEON|nr:MULTISPECIES: hypothetical protein [Thermococcus]ACJ16691.1 hypothetical protein TON_1203 [Thermococcus onnurineus NA1]NJE47532.1 hypothetical protein [Thermococcus sp. GR7]NJE78540.1 hypothetical protein [Thermococcus sp. GR4]NJF24007.1 hypothetical protein [Thermococcus sp. GR5]